ncbi:MAG: peptidoglycan DD-metalloendopeptidase family protein [Pseudomonadota bacterium]|nr:peptidoglycan DD-metalloendopeptidase family protein [Pseudomonadota bacterium]
MRTGKTLLALIGMSALLFALQITAHASDKKVKLGDDVTGVEVSVPGNWKMAKDPVLFDTTYGFALYAATEHGREHTSHDMDAVARIAIAYKAKPHQLEQMVAAKMEEYKEFNPIRSDVIVGRGHRGVAITGLPGTQPYTIVYAKHGNRIYEIGLWADQVGIDARGRSVLASIEFKQPMRAVESLGLEDADTAAYRLPPVEQQIRNAKAEAERREHVQAARSRGELAENDAPEPSGMTTASCGFTAPTGMYWQLQWDGSNTFYSGSHYNLRSVPGWSAMSGNGGSWWGTNYHVGLCYTNQSNQYYANDWPAQRGANAYAAFSGYVEWAGWGTDGFWTLGNYVVVRNGSYRSVTAHLNGIANGIYWGAYIDGYYKVIGWAGSTGGNWAPHLHARVSWGESLTANGQPYGGQSVRPSRLRCFTCKNQDVTTTSGAKSYTRYSHGEWMKY